MFTQHGFVSFVKYDPSHDVTGVGERFLPGYSKWLDETVRTENPGASRRAQVRVRRMKDIILNEGVLLARARDPEHLDQLLKYYPEFIKEEDSAADYKSRGLIPLRAVKAWLAGECDELQYNSHFKEQFRDNAPNGKKWYSNLLSVWSAMNSSGYTSGYSSYSGGSSWSSGSLCDVKPVKVDDKGKAQHYGQWCNASTEDGHKFPNHSFQKKAKADGKPIPDSTDMEPYASDSRFSSYQLKGKQLLKTTAGTTTTTTTKPPTSTTSLPKKEVNPNSAEVVAAAQAILDSVKELISGDNDLAATNVTDYVEGAVATLLLGGSGDFLIDPSTPEAVYEMYELVLMCPDVFSFDAPLTVAQVCAILYTCSEATGVAPETIALYKKELERWRSKDIIVDVNSIRDAIKEQFDTDAVPAVPVTTGAGQSGS